MKKIMVTGANGYIGKQLVWWLKKNKYKVYGYDKHFDDDIMEHLDEAREPIIGNTVSEISKTGKFDAVVHLAAISSVPAFNADPVGSTVDSLASLQYALSLDTKVFIFASSAAAAVPKNKRSHYGEMKRICEDLIQSTAPNYLNLRLHNVIGRFSKCPFVENHDPETHLIPNIVKNGELTIFGDGSQVRDYVTVNDVCDVIEKTIRTLKDDYSINSTVEIGTGKGHSVLDVVREYNKLTKKKLPIEFVGERKGDVDVLTAPTPVQTYIRHMENKNQFHAKPWEVLDGATYYGSQPEYLSGKPKNYIKNAIKDVIDGYKKQD